MTEKEKQKELRERGAELANILSDEYNYHLTIRLFGEFGVHHRVRRNEEYDFISLDKYVEWAEKKLKELRESNNG